MKKKVALAALIVLILGSIVIYVVILKRRLGPSTPSPYYNEEYLLNFIEHESANPSDAVEVVHILDAYFILGQKPPNKNELFRYLNNTQGDDGTWMTGTYHYVPNTALTLMEYEWAGIEPKKSLDPFLMTIDTWEKLDSHVRTYDPGNYWGGLWGYVTVYVVCKHQPPPWVSQFLNKIQTEFDTWAYDNHQRNHVIGMLYELRQPLPRKDEVLELYLQQQNPDGGWSESRSNPISWTTETSLAIGALRTTYNPAEPRIASAIDKGLAFIQKNYQEGKVDDKVYAGYSNEIGQKPFMFSTARALSAITGKALPFPQVSAP